MKSSSRGWIVAAIAVALFAAVASGYWWGRSRPEAPPSTAATGSQGERAILYWYDPMVPDEHFDKPGKSPFMDMMLVPKYADGDTGSGIRIDPDLRRSLGVRTVVAEPGVLEAGVRVPGTIAWNLREEHVVSARVDAVVDRLYVRAPFERVRAGQPLATLIAPEWSTAIAEARAAGQGTSASARDLRGAAAARLRAIGVPPGARVLGNGRVMLTAPAAGIVSEIGARQGEAAPAGTLLFRLNGNDRVWLEAAIPQAGRAGIGLGTPAVATVDAFPGATFRGEVEALLPKVDRDSRTQEARIVLDNPAGLLAPGMFAQVTLQPVAAKAYPLVPTNALVGSGDEARMIVQAGDGSFQPVAVQAGRSSGGMTEILSGLDGGERVVASGQFLIDSEASLSGALERLDAGTADDNHQQGHSP
jgi:Cu(I)/Ag(I) efflux system membrane fusion protein